MVINKHYEGKRERGKDWQTYNKSDIYTMLTINTTGGLSIPFLLMESLAIIVYEYLTPWTKLLIT